LVSVDVTDTGQIEAAVNKASELGPLRLLVNSAGIGSAQRTIGKDGHVAAFDGQIGQAAYSSSKGGVVGMTLPVARDLAAAGIRVNTIAPGLIDTPIYGECERSEAFKAKLGESVLFPPRLGRPDELASMVVELVTNSYMNAEVVRVDGGIRMPPKSALTLRIAMRGDTPGAPVLLAVSSTTEVAISTRRHAGSMPGRQCRSASGRPDLAVVQYFRCVPLTNRLSMMDVGDVVAGLKNDPLGRGDQLP
jgi:hypothetical protein